MKFSSFLIAIVTFLTACSQLQEEQNPTGLDFYTIRDQHDRIIGQFVQQNSDTLHLEYLRRNSADSKWFIKDKRTTSLIKTNNLVTEWTTLDEVEFEKYLFLQYADSSKFSQTTVDDQDLYFAELLYLKDSLHYSVWFDPSIEDSLSFLPDINGQVIKLEIRQGSELLEHWKIDKPQRIDAVDLLRKSDSLKYSGTSFYPEVYLMNPKEGTPFPPDLFVSIETEDQRSGLPIFPFELVVSRNGDPYYTTEVDSGTGEFYLPLKGQYKLEINAEGYLSKNIVIDLGDHPTHHQMEGYVTHLNFTLFEPIDHFPDSVLSLPIGKAFYDSSSQSILFDMDYTEHRQKIIKEAWEEALSKDSSTP